MSSLKDWFSLRWSVLVSNWLSILFPNSGIYMSDKHHIYQTNGIVLPITTPGLNEQKLREIYKNYRNPAVKYETFAMRVDTFKWSILKAIRTPHKTDKGKIAGKFDTHSEIYNSANNPAVPFKVFLLRINRYHWSIENALYTPLKRRVKKYI